MKIYWGRRFKFVDRGQKRVRVGFADREVSYFGKNLGDGTAHVHGNV
jgi:hypothetical protein